MILLNSFAYTYIYTHIPHTLTVYTCVCVCVCVCVCMCVCRYVHDTTEHDCQPWRQVAVHRGSCLRERARARVSERASERASERESAREKRARSLESAQELKSARPRAPSGGPLQFVCQR